MDELTKQVTEAFAKALKETNEEVKQKDDEKDKDATRSFSVDGVAKAVGTVITQFLGDDFKGDITKEILGKLKESGVKMDEPDVKISDLTVKELNETIGTIIEDKVTEAVKKSGIKVPGIRKSQGKDAIDDVPTDDDKDDKDKKDEPEIEKTLSGFNKTINKMSSAEYKALPEDDKKAIRSVGWSQLLFGKKSEAAGISVDDDE